MRRDEKGSVSEVLVWVMRWTSMRGEYALRRRRMHTRGREKGIMSCRMSGSEGYRCMVT
jgi:hypothetical protein